MLCKQEKIYGRVKNKDGRVKYGLSDVAIIGHAFFFFFFFSLKIFMQHKHTSKGTAK